jgi:NhaP-type Na+/H+ or K+/H+ antiporter
VLAVFSRLGADPNLYSLVFGESVLNDAVAMVLFGSLSTFLSTPATPAAVGAAAAGFVGVFAASMAVRGAGRSHRLGGGRGGGGLLESWVGPTRRHKSLCCHKISNPAPPLRHVRPGVQLGCGVALLAAALVRTGYFRSSHSPLESSLVVLLGYAAYTLGDGLRLSGIVAVLFCGLFMARYVRPNLAPSSRARVGAAPAQADDRACSFQQAGQAHAGSARGVAKPSSAATPVSSPKAVPAPDPPPPPPGQRLLQAAVQRGGGVCVCVHRGLSQHRSARLPGRPVAALPGELQDAAAMPGFRDGGAATAGLLAGMWQPAHQATSALPLSWCGAALVQGVSFAALALSRALNVVPCCAAVNLLRAAGSPRIPASHQLVLWWSGLRGAMAFAIALQAADAVPGGRAAACSGRGAGNLGPPHSLTSASMVHRPAVGLTMFCVAVAPAPLALMLQRAAAAQDATAVSPPPPLLLRPSAAPPAGSPGQIMLSATYFIVLATVLVNGGSCAFMLKRLQLRTADSARWGPRVPRLGAPRRTHPALPSPCVPAARVWPITLASNCTARRLSFSKLEWSAGAEDSEGGDAASPLLHSASADEAAGGSPLSSHGGMLRWVAAKTPCKRGCHGGPPLLHRSRSAHSGGGRSVLGMCCPPNQSPADRQPALSLRHMASLLQDPHTGQPLPGQHVPGWPRELWADRGACECAHEHRRRRAARPWLGSGQPAVAHGAPTRHNSRSDSSSKPRRAAHRVQQPHAVGGLWRPALERRQMSCR